MYIHNSSLYHRQGVDFDIDVVRDIGRDGGIDIAQVFRMNLNGAGVVVSVVRARFDKNEDHGTEKRARSRDMITYL